MVIINITNKSTLTTFQTEAKNGDVSRNKYNTTTITNIHTPCVSSDVHVSTDDQSKFITFNFITWIYGRSCAKTQYILFETIKWDGVGRNYLPFHHYLYHIPITYSTYIIDRIYGLYYRPNHITDKTLFSTHYYKHLA